MEGEGRLLPDSWEETRTEADEVVMVDVDMVVTSHEEGGGPVLTVGLIRPRTPPTSGDYLVHDTWTGTDWSFRSRVFHCC